MPARNSLRLVFAKIMLTPFNFQTGIYFLKMWNWIGIRIGTTNPNPKPQGYWVFVVLRYVFLVRIRMGFTQPMNSAFWNSSHECEILIRYVLLNLSSAHFRQRRVPYQPKKKKNLYHSHMIYQTDSIRRGYHISFDTSSLASYPQYFPTKFNLLFFWVLL